MSYLSNLNLFDSGALNFLLKKDYVSHYNSKTGTCDFYHLSNLEE